MVIRVPSGTQYGRYDIVSFVRRARLVSFIPQRESGHALSTVHVVKFAEATLGQKLFTTKKWITVLYTGSLPCTMSCQGFGLRRGLGNAGKACVRVLAQSAF